MSRASGETGENRTMNARNRATGAAIVGTVEIVTGTASVEEESFKLDERGDIQCESAGNGTDMDWDSGTQRIFEGEPMYVDDDGEHVKESEIELYSECCLEIIKGDSQQRTDLGLKLLCEKCAVAIAANNVKTEDSESQDVKILRAAREVLVRRCDGDGTSAIDDAIDEVAGNSCDECGADLGDGEGYDGRCGNCADRAEGAKAGDFEIRVGAVEVTSSTPADEHGRVDWYDGPRGADEVILSGSVAKGVRNVQSGVGLAWDWLKGKK